MTTESSSSSSFSADDARSLLGAYALDAVDADERAAVEHLVATDPSAAAELAQLTAVAATLGDAVAGDPPAALRATVLAAIADVPQLRPLAGPSSTRTDAAPPTEPGPIDTQPPVLPGADGLGTPVVPGADGLGTPVVPGADVSRAPVVPGPESAPGIALTSAPEVAHLADRRRPSRTRWLAVAAALVVGAAIPTALAVQQAQRATQAEEQQQALADLLTDPTAVVVHGDVAGGGAATAILTDDRALFSATGLPDPGDDRAYQLWVVDADGATSAGVLADDGGTVRQLTDDFSTGDALAITIEPSTGSTQPTTAPLVVLAST